ncbi:MAG: hypothetical protein A3K19_01305 [Lentisphaerae bacterium RIFOXYB12_FULL_65_16]|nr:MAG: hypothetical protein A3K18_06185 [Lentisphaerae bacterium RIFOXYA12_64_32]OGV92534.1 MAG: hypothetical protein A3K19_01305 [Lentisphaerae bacterium RIFOXYB12_FULL_65_16]
MNLFLDHTLPPKLAQALNATAQPGHGVVHVRDRFPAHSDTVHWTAALAHETGLSILTVELRTRPTPHALRAWQEAGHTIFFLKPGWLRLPFEKQTDKLAKFLPALIERALQAPRGTCFSVAVNGTIEPFTSAG